MSKELSDEQLRQKLIGDRVTDLIGTPEKKDTFFIYGRGTVRRPFGRNVCGACTDLSRAKRAEPKGLFEHRAIKEVIIKTIFTASRGSECLADCFETNDIFNPVPLQTIALAATAVKSRRCYKCVFSYLFLLLLFLDLLRTLGVEEWNT